MRAGDIEMILKKSAAERLGSLGGSEPKKMKWHPYAEGIVAAVRVVDPEIIPAELIRKIKAAWQLKWPRLPEDNNIRNWLAK
jgi:hypothetical protein